MRQIRSAEVEAVKKSWVWDKAIDTLYELCAKYPMHTEVDEIIAKVLLIGRSNAAAIERRKDKPVVGNFYTARVAPCILNADIDKWFGEIKTVATAGCPESIIVHRKLQNLFFRISGLAKRSLASKYLHFHFPNIFFIYDSQAARAIRRVVPHLTMLPKLKARPADRVYSDFVRRCKWLQERLRVEHSIQLTPRQIDRLLLKIADKELRRRTTQQ